jgi:predicted transglutaminase-like cysteine proteinase
MGAMRHARSGQGSARVFSKTISTLGLAVGLALIAGSAETRTAASQPSIVSLPIAMPAVVRNAQARPTAGWVRFCEQMPAECAVDPAEPGFVQLTPETWKTILRVNRQVNGSIKAKTDLAHWGEEDRWDFAEDGYGDCEDYQLVKRRRLVEAGFPRRALRMTVVIDDIGEGHAVMMVRTDRGDFILDNKRNAVLPWNQTGYTYVKREGDAGTAWASLGGVVTSPVTTAGR